MEANELRLGSKLRSGVHVITVTGIHRDTILKNKTPHIYVDGYAGKNYCFKLHEISPIELIPEILEECGFNNKGAFYTINNIISFGYTDGKLHTTYIGDSVIPPIQYLHQLQNLYFALTSKELEINL